MTWGDHADRAATSAADRAFLGLEATGDGTAAFTLTPGLARLDGKLYGGTAMAAAVMVAEQATDRGALWMTVQFVSGATETGDRIDVTVDVRAHGRRTSQVRVVGRRGDEVIFDALGATAIPKEGAPSAAFPPMPEVAAPQDCEPLGFPFREGAEPAGFLGRMEIRRARATDPADRGFRLWARVAGHDVTPALLGYLSDWVPSSVVNALGGQGGGTSLDNTLRLGHPHRTEWVLLDLQPHLAHGGYGHGVGHLWSPDGVLLGTASQTSSLIVVG